MAELLSSDNEIKVGVSDVVLKGENMVIEIDSVCKQIEAKVFGNEYIALSFTDSYKDFDKNLDGQFVDITLKTDIMNKEGISIGSVSETKKRFWLMKSVVKRSVNDSNLNGIRTIVLSNVDDFDKYVIEETNRLIDAIEQIN